MRAPPRAGSPGEVIAAAAAAAAAATSPSSSLRGLPDSREFAVLTLARGLGILPGVLGSCGNYFAVEKVRLAPGNTHTTRPTRGGRGGRGRMQNRCVFPTGFLGQRHLSHVRFHYVFVKMTPAPKSIPI